MKINLEYLLDDFVRATGCSEEDKQALTEKIFALVKEEKEEIIKNKPIMCAYLKHDLYVVDERRVSFGYYSLDNIPQIARLVLPKGTQFLYFEEGGWYDDGGYGIECADNEFADEHLSTPTVIRRKIK